MLDVVDIQKILPHRYPFLLVDRVTELKKMESIVAYKNVSISEPVFEGHFPGHPIYPGVMILEGMAQAGGILGLKSGDLSEEELENKVIYFMSIDNAKFRQPVRPGDRLEYRLSIVKFRKSVVMLEAKAFVDDTLVAEADLKAMIVDK
jgi:3-hydroxyacyl-[acyl-carrier-protein] dehydratase